MEGIKYIGEHSEKCHFKGVGKWAWAVACAELHSKAKDYTAKSKGYSWLVIPCNDTCCGATKAVREDVISEI